MLDKSFGLLFYLKSQRAMRRVLFQVPLKLKFFKICANNV
jgi:hypothetical protein